MLSLEVLKSIAENIKSFHTCLTPFFWGKLFDVARGIGLAFILAYKVW